MPTTPYTLTIEPPDETRVTNTADSGPGSLREAILRANATAGPAVIEFRIASDDPNFVDVDATLPGGDSTPDVFVITPLSPLPALENPLGGILLDGRSQAGFGDDTNPAGPEVVLDGILAGAGANGLHLRTGHHQVRGLGIQRFLGNGVLITGPDNI